MEKYNYRLKLSSSEQFVRNLYQCALKREGEERGVNFYKNSLGETPTFEDASKLLIEFMRSDEFSNLRAWQATKTSPWAIINHFFSIGSHCLTSSMLKKLRLRSQAGPFDWIFSSIPMVSHCINDDFDKLLDKQYYYKTLPEDRVVPTANICDHIYYKEQFNINFVFNHTDVSESVAYQHFVMSVEKFRSALKSENNIMLVGIVRLDVCPDRVFIDLCASLEKFPKVSVIIFRSIELCENKFGADLALESGPHKLFDLFMLGNIGPTNFTNGVDEIIFCSVLDRFVYVPACT